MKQKILIIVSVLSVIGVFMMPSIPQDMSYHQFADQREILGIANFVNVLSNIPFIVIGIAGVNLLASGRKVVLVESIRFIYGVFFFAIILIGLGSCWYHLEPDNSTLLWDRLPMTVAFVSFFCIVLAEFIHTRLALVLFPLLLFLGPASVLYWYWTESLGQGDLRLYILVQYLPVVLMPIILLSYNSRFTRVYFLWMVLACYGVAKGFEILDSGLYEFFGEISGHTLKHLVSAIAPLMLYAAISTRGIRERGAVYPAGQ